MADDFALPILPRAQAALVATGNNQSRGSAYQQGGAADAGSLRPSAEWYEFFRKLLAFVDANSDIAAEIAALLERLETLEGAQIVGQNSVISFGSLSEGLVTLMLRGDVAAPGEFMYYGAGPNGTRGFWPAAQLVAWMVDENGDYLVDENGDYMIGQDITADLFAIVDTSAGFVSHTSAGAWAARTIQQGAGVTVSNGDGVGGDPTIAHADTSSVSNVNFDNSNGVVLQDLAVTFDTFGHVQSITAATVNLDARYGAALSAGGTTGQFWRGDKAWTNSLAASLLLENNANGNGPIAGLFGLYVSPANGDNAFVTFDSYGASTGFLARVCNGTAAAKTATQANNILIQVQGRGHDGTNYSGEAIGMIMSASENWTPTAQGTQLLFRTNRNGQNTPANRLGIDGAANVFVGASASAGGGVGVVSIQNAATAPTSNPTGGGILYVEGGALKYRGSSGTVTTIAPA